MTITTILHSRGFLTKETPARSCLAFVSIRPKVWMRKYQKHLAFDCVRLHVLDRKTGTPERETQRNIFQAGEFNSVTTLNPFLYITSDPCN